MLDRAEQLLHYRGQPILVEEFIEGRELHVGILGNDSPHVLPIIEFDFSEFDADHPKIISYNAKWNPLDETYHRVHTICPANLSKRVLKKVEEVTLYLIQQNKEIEELKAQVKALTIKK